MVEAAIIRQYLGLIGSGDGLISGERQPFDIASGPIAVPAASSVLVPLVLTLPILQSRDALFLEYVAGQATASDNGALSIGNVTAIISDPVFGLLPLQVIPPAQGGFRAVANDAVGFFLATPQPIRLKDLRRPVAGQPVTQPLTLTVSMSFANSGALAHNVAVLLAGYLRVFSGVEP